MTQRRGDNYVTSPPHTKFHSQTQTASRFSRGYTAADGAAGGGGAATNFSRLRFLLAAAFCSFRPQTAAMPAVSPALREVDHAGKWARICEQSEHGAARVQPAELEV